MTAIKNVAIHTVFLSILLIFKEFAETSWVTQILMAHFCRMSRLASSCLLIFVECLIRVLISDAGADLIMIMIMTMSSSIIYHLII